MALRHLTGPLTRIFRPDNTEPTAPVAGAAALEPQAAERLAATALGGGDVAARTAAVEHLADGAALRSLAGLSGVTPTPAPPAVELAARARMAHLIDAGTVDFDALRTSCGPSDALLSIAALCADHALLDTAFAAIDDPQRIVALVNDGASSRIRQLAAQRIDDPTALKDLTRQLRGKDKSVYKIIKDKSDALRAQEQRLVQIETDAQAACAALERLSHRFYDATYEASLRLTLEPWTAIAEHAAPDVQARAQRAIADCHAAIAEHARQLELRASQEAQRSAEQAARAAAAAQAEVEAQQRAEAAALAAAQARLQREAEAAAHAQRDAAQAVKLRQLTGLIARTNAALREGDTGRAAGLRRAIDDKLPSVPDVPPHVARQVQQLDEKLAELKQWKDFAVAPKRAELIAEMEGLIGSTEAPQALADRIKQLQEDWKTISKGIISDSEADWQRFHQASQTAYLPCRAYFEAQSKGRQTNLENRAKVLARLQAFAGSIDAERPDWRAIAAVLREAPQEFRKYSPVDRAAGRQLQESFDAALEQLRARIETWYAANAAEKRGLIERAKHMLTKTDQREAADGIKHLQQLWKNIGSAEHRDEQRLWEEFRAQCDAVFAKRQEAFSAKAATLETNKAAAIALCEEAEGAAALVGSALSEATAKIGQWRDAFEALGELPRADQRSLQNRFERAIKQCQAQIAAQRARAQEESFTHLFEASRLIRAYGWSIAESAPAEEREALKLAAESYCAAVTVWPKGAAPALKDAWLKAAGAKAADSAANETALRMLCIRSETHTERSTPPEDQALRREYQVKRLMQRMGHGEEQSADDLNSLAFEWVRIGAVPATTAGPLLARFLRCRGTQQ